MTLKVGDKVQYRFEKVMQDQMIGTIIEFDPYMCEVRCDEDHTYYKVGKLVSCYTDRLHKLGDEVMKVGDLVKVIHSNKDLKGLIVQINQFDHSDDTVMITIVEENETKTWKIGTQAWLKKELLQALETDELSPMDVVRVRHTWEAGVVRHFENLVALVEFENNEMRAYSPYELEKIS